MSPQQTIKEIFICTVSAKIEGKKIESKRILEAIAAYLKVDRNALVFWGPTEGARPRRRSAWPDAFRDAMRRVGTRPVIFYEI